MLNVLDFSVKELILVNNLVQHPSVSRTAKVKDIRLIDGITKKIQSKLGKTPEPEGQLSDKEEDKESNQLLIKQYEDLINNWMNESRQIKLTDTELTTIKLKIDAFTGLSVDPDDRAVLMSVLDKIGM